MLILVRHRGVRRRRHRLSGRRLRVRSQSRVLHRRHGLRRLRRFRRLRLRRSLVGAERLRGSILILGH